MVKLNVQSLLQLLVLWELMLPKGKIINGGAMILVALRTSGLASPGRFKVLRYNIPSIWYSEAIIGREGEGWGNGYDECAC